MADYEHLIVDGASTDATVEILSREAGADPRIKYTSEPDSGMYDAINKGLRRTSADLVAYINTDDFYLPGALQRVVRAFAEHPEASLIYGHWMSWHPERSFLEILPVHQYSAEDMAHFASLPQPSVFFRRSLFDALSGFDLSYKLLADNELFSRAAAAGFRCLRIDEYLSVQTIHAGNLYAGNRAAATLAKAESDRYRLARQAELSRHKNFFQRALGHARSTVTHGVLLALWRATVLTKLARGVRPESAEARAGLWPAGATFSLYRLVRYLGAFSNRNRHAYVTVSPEQLASSLNFVPPDPRLSSERGSP